MSGVCGQCGNVASGKLLFPHRAKYFCKEKCAGKYIDDFQKQFWKRYKILQILGEGGFGSVYKIGSQSGDVFALKIFKREYKAERDAFQEAQNIAIVSERCPDLVVRHFEPIEIFQPPSLNDRVFAVMMEFYEGLNLAAYTNAYFANPGTENGMQWENFLKPIVNGLVDQIDCLHKNRIFHRDIKPDNIMVQYEFTKVNSVRIIDFGLGCFYDQANLEEKCKSFAGTPHYMAPEAFRVRISKMSPEQLAAIDIFALGITFFRTATGKWPFKKKEPGYYKRNKVKITAGGNFGSIVESMMDLDPLQRPTSSQLKFRMQPRRRKF